MNSKTKMSLSRDTFFYSVANWGQRLVTFVTAPVTIAYFTPADYGYMSLVMTVASFCSILGMLAVVDQGLPRFFIDSTDENEKKGYVTTSLMVSSIGVLAITFTIFVATPIVRVFFEDIRVPVIFTSLIALVCISQSFNYVGSNMLKWTFQSALFMKISFVQTVAAAGLTVGGIVLLGWRAKGILIAGALVALGAGVWANLSVKQYLMPFVISQKKAKELAIYSWPLLGLNIFAFFTRSLDRIFLAALTSLSAVGIFSVSSAVANVFQVLISGFFFAWGPYVLSTYGEIWAPRRYAQLFSAVSFLGIVSIVGLGLWGSSLVMLFRPDGAYREIGVFIPWIVSGTLLYHVGGYFAPGPAIKKKTYWKLIAFILAGTSNAVLNYILIPRLGILGACVATSFSSLIAGVFNQVVSNRLYFVPNRWKLSFTLILIYSILVSFLQLKNPFLNLNEISYSARASLTAALIICGTLPFYQDIKALRLHERFIAWFAKA